MFFVFWIVFYVFFSLIKVEYFGYLDVKLVVFGDICIWVFFVLLGMLKYYMYFFLMLFCVVFVYLFMCKVVEVLVLGGLVVM